MQTKEEKIIKGMERAEKKFIEENTKKEALRKELLEKGLCERCKKNKSTLTYSDSMMSFVHGFKQEICQECYDKIIKSTAGYEKAREELTRILDERIDELENSRKDIPRTTAPKRREVAIRQVTGRILELKRLKNKLK